MSKLQDGGNHNQWQEQMENEGLTKVKDFWVEETQNSSFRVWKPEAWFSTRMLGEARKILIKEL